MNTFKVALRRLGLTADEVYTIGDMARRNLRWIYEKDSNNCIGLWDMSKSEWV